jgi:hypothetical protein
MGLAGRVNGQRINHDAFTGQLVQSPDDEHRLRSRRLLFHGEAPRRSMTLNRPGLEGQQF